VVWRRIIRLDDKQRLAFASFAFLAAVILFTACLVAGAVLRSRNVGQPDLATAETTALFSSEPSSNPTSTASLAETPQLTTTVTLLPPPISAAPTAAAPTLEPTVAPSPTFASQAQDAWCIPWNSPSVSAQVVKVIDGVTIEVSLDGETVPVRYIGVDLVEFGEDATIWTQMTEKNQELVEGKTVLLVEDVADTDSSGQLLRYVIAEGVFTNLEMVSSGYAVAASMPPNQSCDALLLDAQMQATQARLGLWAPEPTATRVLMPSPMPTPLTTGPMVIGLVIYRGTPWQEPDEFVEVLNDGTAPIQLNGWTLQDDANHVFTFPSFVLGPGEHCRVYTNLYSPTTCGFSFFRTSPIWENDADCAYLKDPLGEIISTYCYY
jgi:micrococcal nuclease